MGIKDRTISNEYKKTQIMSKQIEYNINELLKSIKKTARALYVDYNVKELLTLQREDEIYDIIRLKMKLDNYVHVNDSIHSIQVYNSFTKNTYSTFRHLLYNDLSMESLIYPIDNEKRDMLIERKFYLNETQKNDQYLHVFSYVIYDDTYMKEGIPSALVVNVSSDWIMNNISRINHLSHANDAKIFLINDKKHVIASQEYTDEQLALYQGITQDAFVESETPACFEKTYNHKKYLVFYDPIPEENWTLVWIQPYHNLQIVLQSIRYSILVLTIVFLIVGLIIAFFVSDKIYNPVKMLLEGLSTKYNVDTNHSRDEFFLLNQIYSEAFNQLKSYQKESISKKNILHNYYLKKMITQSEQIKDSEWDKVSGEIPLDVHKTLCLILIRIDNFKQFEQKNNLHDRHLLKFAIINVVSEVLNRQFICDGIDLKDDQAIILMNTSDDYTEDTVASLLVEAQAFIEKHIELSISFTISEPWAGKSLITKHYLKALLDSNRRYILGRGAMITSSKESLKVKEGDQPPLTHEDEVRIRGLIKTKDQEGLFREVNLFFDTVSSYPYTTIKSYIVYLVNVFISTFQELHQYSFSSYKMDIDEMIYKVIEYEVIDDAKTCILHYIESYFMQQENHVEQRHKLLAEAIKEIIDTNYNDSGLYTQYIANLLNMSSNHISKVFKDTMHISIKDYINDVRLSKAVQLLLNTQLTIDQIMLEVGIDNRSYFYRLFKKKYGTTPREYSYIQSMKNSNKS